MVHGHADGLWSFAYTARLDAAAAHLADRARYPIELDASEIDAAHLALTALEERSPDVTDRAITAWTAIADRSKSQTRAAIGLTAMLGRTDQALAMTASFLSPYRSRPLGTVPGTSFLFSPQLASLRDAPTFRALCRDVGLERCWRDSGTRPDVAAGRLSS